MRKAIATFDTNSTSSVSALRELGATLMLQGRYVEAESTLRSALAILQQHGGSDIFASAATRIELGKLMRLEHRAADAMALLQTASDVYEHADANDRNRPRASAALSEAQLDAGDRQTAFATAQTSLSQARKSAAAALPAGRFATCLGPGRSRTWPRRCSRAPIAEALAVRSPPYPANDLRTLEVQVALVNALTALGRSDDAHALQSSIEPLLTAASSPYAIDLLKRLDSSAWQRPGTWKAVTLQRRGRLIAPADSLCMPHRMQMCV